MNDLEFIQALLEFGQWKGNCKPALPFDIGQKYFIRTITHHLTGQVVDIKGKFLILSDSAWIPDDGRFMNCINDGKVNECEPTKVDAILNTDTIIDAYVWIHPLPRVQK